MAIRKIVRDKYGMLELNNASFPRTGRVEAQCYLANNFTEAAPAEIGMLLAVDKANRLIKLPTAGETLPIALNYSTEKIYNQFTPGLKNYFMVYNKDFMPRMGFLSIGETFTTNCLAFDDAEFATDEAFWDAMDDFETTPLFGGMSTIGDILVSATRPAVGPALRVVKNYTMPDGQPGLKFQVDKA